MKKGLTFLSVFVCSFLMSIFFSFQVEAAPSLVHTDNFLLKDVSYSDLGKYYFSSTNLIDHEYHGDYLYDTHTIGYINGFLTFESTYRFYLGNSNMTTLSGKPYYFNNTLDSSFDMVQLIGSIKPIVSLNVSEGLDTSVFSNAVVTECNLLFSGGSIVGSKTSDGYFFMRGFTPYLAHLFNGDMTIVEVTVVYSVMAYKGSSSYASSSISSISPSITLFMLPASWQSNWVIQFYNSGDVQSSDIVSQTDELTTGFNNSGMDSSNTALSGALTEYDNLEKEATDQSVGFIDDVSFFDPSSQVQLMTCITYCSSWLQSLFVALGDWSILVMVSLSLTLGLMLVGWFKYRK